MQHNAIDLQKPYWMVVMAISDGGDGQLSSVIGPKTLPDIQHFNISDFDVTAQWCQHNHYHYDGDDGNDDDYGDDGDAGNDDVNVDEKPGTVWW